MQSKAKEMRWAPVVECCCKAYSTARIRETGLQRYFMHLLISQSVAAMLNGISMLWLMCTVFGCSKPGGGRVRSAIMNMIHGCFH